MTSPPTPLPQTDLLSAVGAALGLTPTAEQQAAMAAFARFAADRSPASVMVMRGAAGTGKTTLAAAIVTALLRLRQKLVLMAPTGRAAKVFALYAGHPAYTIHRRIYRQRSAGDLSAFSLNDNLHTDTLFIVDEASMIANDGNTASGGTFGSGHLLDDLIRYVYQGAGCHLMLIGDSAQLPPVGETQSPALSSDMLAAYGLSVHEADLSEVLRQSQQSGILYNATRLRQQGLEDALLPRIRLKGFADIRVVPGDELIEQLAASYSRVGVDDTIVITRSNKLANVYNQGIRCTVLDREDELCRGDQLLIVKNNYFWLKPTQQDATPSPSQGEAGGGVAVGPGFLANGDRCVVQRMRNVRQLYGFRFADVTIQLPDYDDLELTVTLLLDTLSSEAPALTREQQEQLYQQVMADYADVPLKAERLRRLRQDAHYNALQVKHGYAVTCHKAQGGQWAHVYIDQGYMTDDMLTPDYLHWLYTAFTRATERLYLVNWPKAQLDDAE